jgi:hypothetical protein
MNKELLMDEFQMEVSMKKSPSYFPTFMAVLRFIAPSAFARKVFFQTRFTLFGLPLICVADEALGVVAIGRKATGVLAIGSQALGCFSLGVMSTGLASFGVCSLSIFLSAGVVAVSLGYSMGVIAIGAVSIGLSTRALIEFSGSHLRFSMFPF